MEANEEYSKIKKKAKSGDLTAVALLTDSQNASPVIMSSSLKQMRASVGSQVYDETHPLPRQSNCTFYSKGKTKTRIMLKSEFSVEALLKETNDRRC